MPRNKTITLLNCQCALRTVCASAAADACATVKDDYSKVRTVGFADRVDRCCIYSTHIALSYTGIIKCATVEEMSTFKSHNVILSAGSFGEGAIIIGCNSIGVVGELQYNGTFEGAVVINYGAYTVFVATKAYTHSFPAGLE